MIVASFVSQLALGNSKSSDLDLLELDRSSGRLEAEFTLHHRHVWPSIREAQAKLRTARAGRDRAQELADRLPDAAFEAARTLFREADSKGNEASAKAREAQKKAREAADRVATKRQELATLASDLARAQTDLRAASELEARARQEAQAACVLRCSSSMPSYASREMEPPQLGRRRFPARSTIHGSRRSRHRCRPGRRLKSFAFTGNSAFAERISRGAGQEFAEISFFLSPTRRARSSCHQNAGCGVQPASREATGDYHL